jgi:thymidylate kinase
MAECMKNDKHILIEGIDRLGKSTLISNIQKALGFYPSIHYAKPIVDAYKTPFDAQYDAFVKGMRLINSSPVSIIFDRFHLGEYVYSPLYRDYDGSYIFELEQRYKILDKCILIVLTTSNFDCLIDDGEGYNFDNKQSENISFLEAFEKSNINQKKIVNVSNSEGFRNPEDIANDVLTFIGS